MRLRTAAGGSATLAKKRLAAATTASNEPKKWSCVTVGPQPAPDLLLQVELGCVAG